jgi:hypothetical protein
MKRFKRYSLPALLTLTVLTTLFFLFSGVVGAQPNASQARSPIPGHLIPALQGHSPTGDADGQKTLNLTISLRLADPAGLQTLINAQNDRSSALYHQYLTPQQFTGRFAPSQAHVDAVIAYLRSQGLSVGSVAANRLSIKASGTVASIEQAFNVHIANYSLNGHTVYAPTNEPSVPSSLAGMILNIGGLDNTSTPHRIGAVTVQTPLQPARGPDGGYAPNELRTAYDMNSLISQADGTGQTVAIAELDGYIPSDVDFYLSHYGLGSSKYTNVLVDGALNIPSVLGGALEVELDMEVVSAIAPGANQEIYIAPNTFQGFLDLFNQIVVDNTAKVVSDSWGLCEAETGSSAMQAFDAVFAQGAAQGQAFYAASGDAGAYDCGDTTLGVDFPASDPNVVGVGGTQLNVGTNGTYSSESAWACPPPGPNNLCTQAVSGFAKGFGGGGGVSSLWPRPAYQTGPGVNTGSGAPRQVPDVSADASNVTPYSEYCTDSSGCLGLGWISVFGTSAAAPLWAGITADLNQYLIAQHSPTLGSASAALYWLFNTSHPYAAYHDVKTGNNLFYSAGTGYDLATGIGTPDVWNIARDFVAAAPTVSPNPLYLVTETAVNPPPQTVTIANTGFKPFNWSLGALDSQITPSATSGTVAANSTQQITLTFNLSSFAHPFTTTMTVNDADGVIPAITVPITVVPASISKTWYFAEGFTGTGFTEYLTLANPNDNDNVVTVQYLLQNAAPITKQFTLQANSRATINVNSTIDGVGPNQNVSMVVTGTLPLIAERPMYFNFGGKIPGGSDVLGATSLSQDFDFGYLDTTANHSTYLTILNQDPINEMDVQITYFSASGAPTIINHTVSANSRGTVNVNAEGLPQGTYSALVHLSLPGLVERPLYLKDATTGFTGAADVVGVAQPLPDWDFAEGFVSSTFTERYILSNPSTTDTATGTITFFLDSGSPVTTNFTLTPGQQKTILVNSLLTGNNSAHVHADHDILAERFMSFKFGTSIPGATDVLGAGQPSNLFEFAEGFTGTGFSEYLTIANPNASQAATVQVTFLPSDGSAPLVRVYTIAPSTRFTLNTATVITSAFKNRSFSMVVESNVSIVAERPMYFNFPGGRTGGSDVVGYQP